MGTAVDGKEKYYNQLYAFLKDNGYLYDRHENLKWRRDFSDYYRIFAWNEDLCERLKKEYGYNAKNVLLVNSKKFYVISEYYQKDVSVANLRCGIIFLLLGCLIDHLLDAGDTHQRCKAKRKLSWEYCGDYFCGNTNMKEDDVIDALYMELARVFKKIRGETPQLYTQILEILNKAINAELNVVSSTTLDSEKMIMNKSVLFVVIAGMIGMHDAADIEKIESLFYKMGEAFSIIDDLCDCFEDADCGQKNLVNIMKKDFGEEKTIMMLGDRLNKTMLQLQRTTSSKIYAMILQQIQEWTMSNSYIRERVWLDNG